MNEITCPICKKAAFITPAEEFQRLKAVKGKAGIYIRCYRCKLYLYDNSEEEDFNVKLKSLTEKWERLKTE